MDKAAFGLQDQSKKYAVMNSEDHQPFVDEDANGPPTPIPEVCGSQSGSFVLRLRFGLFVRRYKAALQPYNPYISVTLLVFINLLNYIDRFTIAGILDKVNAYFSIGESESGLLQTAFVCTYMVFSPIFGYMGDRYTRKWIVVVGVLSWSLLTLASSFFDRGHFWWFLTFRSLVGIGEASYSTIASTIIADLFVGQRRSTMLMIFYFAIPIGGALGYVVGSSLEKAFGEWQYALRATPLVGLVLVLLVILLLQEPKRGQAESADHVTTTSFCTDVRRVISTPSFVLSTLGFTCVSYTTGALAWWCPSFLTYASTLTDAGLDSGHIALLFGIVTAVSGLTGVAAGSFSARFLRKRLPWADAFVCGFGVLLCAPFLFMSLQLSRTSVVGTFVLVFVGETLIFVNWSLVVEILLNVVIPCRRSIANAIQIFVAHLLGDAGSPYLVGQISEALRGGSNATAIQYDSMRKALYSTVAASALGGILFLCVCRYYVIDRRKMLAEIAPASSVQTDSNEQVVT